MLKAVVSEIYKNMVNVITIETGHTMSINYKLQKVLVETSHAPDYIYIMEKNSKLPPTKLQLFSTVNIVLSIGHDNKVVASFVSPDRQQRRLNSKEDKKNNSADKQNNSAVKKEKKTKRKDKRNGEEHCKRYYALKDDWSCDNIFFSN